MSIEERCALWLAGDVYLHCVVREGLNLKPFEVSVRCVRWCIGGFILYFMLGRMG